MREGPWQPTPVFLPGECQGQRSLGALQSMGSQRVGHDLVTNTFAFHFMTEGCQKWEEIAAFFKKNVFIYICSWLCWVFADVRGLSLVVERGGSRGGGFSCCGAQALQCGLH